MYMELLIDKGHFPVPEKLTWYATIKVPKSLSIYKIYWKNEFKRMDALKLNKLVDFIFFLKSK